MTAKKSAKTGKEFKKKIREGNFAEYIPLLGIQCARILASFLLDAVLIDVRIWTRDMIYLHFLEPIL